MQPDPAAHPQTDAVAVSLSRRFPIEDARCATHPVDLEWVPDHERAVVPPQLAALCRRCDGRANCLLWALAGDEQGYWAGTTAADRTQLRTLGQETIEAADWLQQRARHNANDGALHREGEGSHRWYRKGCHCDECKAANAVARASERANAKARAAA
ncbi:transcription factor WhiB (plasmid) [Xylanimonas cellulosilytica DSM 15894]|uniref:Transcription factor WhiB n=1 Tax=Xylanimonas cellulosilytica (strain DSM 15894 / JCM 12276 / CECT 5975 / KCTC 9989 / LMG 20990 / NBRC 107835 / XIL07) TaxID=446471 RepID=D1C0T3_XYLCX|nr:transcription factor WhiB [Xylanimonas cellulosilytica DSM 15894]